MCVSIFVIVNRPRIHSRSSNCIKSPRTAPTRIYQSFREMIRATVLFKRRDPDAPLVYKSINEYEKEPPHLTDEVLSEVNEG